VGDKGEKRACPRRVTQPTRENLKFRVAQKRRSEKEEDRRSTSEGKKVKKNQEKKGHLLEGKITRTSRHF